MKNIKIIESRSEIGAGTRGASLGSQAIKIASLNDKSDFFDKTPLTLIADQNHLLYKKPDLKWAKNIKGLHVVFKNIAKAVQDTFNEDSFPVVLAGDHSSAAGTIAGVRRSFPNKRIGVIWIDAHADLHSPYTSPSGNVHGMPLAICLDEDNPDNKKRELDEDTKTEWDKLKAVVGICPMIKYEDLVFIGLRDTEAEEDYLLEKNNVKSISITEARLSGMAKTAEDVSNYLEKCDLIYISFDVDSMDCNYISHGTGTPVPVGLSEQEAHSLLGNLLNNEKVSCLEITEVNPTLDEKCNKMAETAFRLLKSTSKVIQNR